MIKMKAVTGAIVLSTLVAACSGGGSEKIESSEENGPAEETAPAEEAVSEEASSEQSATSEPSLGTKDGIAYASLTGDATAGKLVFAQCRTCHVTDPGVNRTGPSLNSIIGREAGTVEGYKYSQANAESGITWSEEQMYAYLENPQKTIPKTKMIFAGIPDAQKRADVIAYLKDPS
jgi:cytochrome c